MTDTELPDFIEQDMLRSIENVEVPDEAILRCFVQSEKPYLSKSAVTDMTDLGDEAVRKRLNSLVDRGILLSDKAGKKTKIYWLHHPESRWPVSDNLLPSETESPNSLRDTISKINKVTVVSIFVTFPWVIFYFLDWVSSLSVTGSTIDFTLNVDVLPSLAIFYLGVILYISLQTSLHVENEDAGWPMMRRIYYKIRELN